MLSEMDKKEIVETALSQTTVDGVLEIIDICWKFSCNVITPKKNEDANGYLDDEDHLGVIYTHALDLVRTQEDALEIYERGFFDGISKNLSLKAFIKFLGFCDLLEKLSYAEEILLEKINTSGLLENEDFILALFEKRHQLQTSNS